MGLFIQGAKRKAKEKPAKNTLSCKVILLKLRRNQHFYQTKAEAIHHPKPVLEEIQKGALQAEKMSISKMKTGKYTTHG